MIQCPLCAAKNTNEAFTCTTCGTELTEECFENYETPISLHAEKVKKSPFKALYLLLACLFALSLAPWFLRSADFRTPKEIQLARQSYQQSVKSYRVNKEKWDKRLESLKDRMGKMEGLDPLLSLSPSPLSLTIEEALSYLLSELQLDSSVSLTFLPSKEGNKAGFLLTKQESLFPFLHPILSVEIWLDSSKGRHEVSFSRLRRGSRTLAKDQALKLFASELQKLERLEAFVSGCKNLKIQRRESQYETPSVYPYVLAWEQEPYRAKPTASALKRRVSIR